MAQNARYNWQKKKIELIHKYLILEGRVKGGGGHHQFLALLGGGIGA
jgi:hypothetical protein